MALIGRGAQRVVVYQVLSLIAKQSGYCLAEHEQMQSLLEYFPLMKLQQMGFPSLTEVIEVARLRRVVQHECPIVVRI